MNFELIHGDVDKLKKLLIKCDMPHNKVHKGIKFLLLFDGEVIGGCRSIISNDGKSALVGSVCILPEYRKIGAGREMLQLMHEYVKLMGVKTFYLASVSTAIDFYKKIGYKCESIINIPCEFVKPLTKTYQEYEQGEYPYKIRQYMRYDV
jgi:N-acetylglutamate synthase-like GNAT family acetyltransferase